MNLNDYEMKYLPVYEAFAKTVRFILGEALRSAENVPKPQSIQCRAKEIERLRRRLTEVGKLDTETLEHDRRDLAGARLIFYTNNDVDRFLASRLIRENFEIEEDSTKIHHPTPENEGVRYRGVHYTVRLREERLRLPEYARFVGMRCEIQVQTILNHAYSETSHDIVYKCKLGDGYGEKAMKGIALRFDRIMDKYLLPAGFEIQKAQQEYERVLQGKELFDKNIAKLLDNAQDNNQRYEILSGLKAYAIPNYDDHSAAYQELKEPLLKTVKAARVTEAVPLKTTYGDMEGFKVDAVTKLVVEIVDDFRYVDANGSPLQLLIDIYRDEPNKDIQQQIVNAVEALSEYNLDVYNRVGPHLQMALVDHLGGMEDAEVDAIRPIALTVWTEAIKSEIRGTKWKADSMVLRRGAVPVSDQLKQVREKAIQALFLAYDRSTTDGQRRDVLSALNTATRTPSQGQYSNELLAMTLKDATRIVEFVTEGAGKMSYELLQHLEHEFYYDYLRTKGLVEDPEGRFACQAEAKALRAAILRFRDRINADDRFVRYKVLVGFESIYSAHWTDEEFEQNGSDEYRNRESDRYIEEINPANTEDWFELVARCADTKSSDLATFPVFGSFIRKLSERKPVVAEQFLSRASEDLRRFLAGFLNGLALSGRSDIYERVLEGELESARLLEGIARHLRYSDVKKPDFAARVLKRAIERGDTAAVKECLLLALENYGTQNIADADKFVNDALSFLNDRKDASWVAEGWFLKKATKFYEQLTPDRMKQALQSLGYLRQVNHQVERILVQLAKRQPEAVWDFFGDRLSQEAPEGEGRERFEPVPFRFHGLEKELSKNIQLAITKGLSWFRRDWKLFQLRGGRLLSSAFPNCTPEFGAALAELVKAGGDMEADFALEILQNYHGETSTYVVLKEVVSRFSDDRSKMARVRISIDSTGVVTGELGLADAYRSKKESLGEWLADDRPVVKAFAEKHIAELDLMITSEQRSAETEREMRIRDYEEEADEANDDGGEDDG